MRRWHEKVIFANIAKWDWFKKAPSTQKIRRSKHKEALSTENARRDWYKKRPFNSIFQTELAQKRSFH